MVHVVLQAETTYDFKTYIEGLRAAQKEADKKEIEKALSHLTPLALYDSKGMLGGWAHDVPTALARFAMRRWTVEPRFPLRHAIIVMLVNGFVLPFIRSDGSVRIEDPHHIYSYDYNDREELTEVIIDYLTEKVNDATKRRIRYRAIYRRQIDEPTTTAAPQEHYTFSEGEYDENVDETKIGEAMSAEVALAEWPYRFIRWIDNCSILEPVKAAILRWEAAFWNIAVDNNRHSRRVKTYQGVTEVKTAPGDVQDGEGREILPPGNNVSAYYADTHPDGIAPMFTELEKLEARIRDITGLTKIEALHNMSGRSRLLEIDPLLAQAEAIRVKCHEIMEKVYGSKYKLHFPALVQKDDAERETAYRNLKDMKNDGVITEDEFIAQSRLLRDLPPLTAKQKRLLDQTRAEREAILTAAKTLSDAAKKRYAEDSEEEDETEEEAEE